MTLNKTSVSLLRRYIFEIAVVALCGVVSVLYFKVDSLNVFIRENLMQQNAAAQKALQENTNALNNFFYNQKQQFQR